MVLIVGGYAQGKRDYVRRAYGAAPEEMAPALGENRVVWGLQDLVRELLDRGEDPLEVLLAHAGAHPEAIYICDEVGAGVIPVDREERAWREAVGRCCVELARRADRVERVFCGLALPLKEEEEH